MRSEAFTKLLILNRSFIALIVAFFSFQQLQARTGQTPEYQVKAAFLYNFTQFVDWPPEAFSSSSAPFVIGIIGPNPFGAYLEELVEGEMIGDRQIIVKNYKDIEELDECHLLYMNIPETEQTKQTLIALNNRSILTVGSSDSFVRSGGMIRLYRAENKIRLEINVKQIKFAQLNVSSKLLSVSRVFDPRGK